MAQNRDYRTTKISFSTKTVEVRRDETGCFKSAKKNGKYILPWETDEQPPDLMSNFRYFFLMDETKIPNEKKLNEAPLMQLMTANSNQIANPPEKGIRVTWLGHASLLLQMDGVNLLVNPNFNHRGIKYYHPGSNKRYRPPVYKVDDLPRIDCVFITNTHFDYLDLTSVRSLNDRFGEMLLWYVPMGVASWMDKAGCSSVVELDWWKEDEVDFVDYLSPDDEVGMSTTSFTITCTPSQNYHSRAFADDNAVLWCSWVVSSPRYKLFFSGATGYYEEIFKLIGKRYGPFHMATLPIGGYEPSWKNSFGNVTPEQAVQIHQDISAMCSLATSWGTFTVSNEFYLEPPKRLSEELIKRGISDLEFFLLRHGESRLVDIQQANRSDESCSHEENETENDEAEADDCAEDIPKVESNDEEEENISNTEPNSTPNINEQDETDE